MEPNDYRDERPAQSRAKRPQGRHAAHAHAHAAPRKARRRRRVSFRFVLLLLMLAALIVGGLFLCRYLMERQTVVDVPTADPSFEPQINVPAQVQAEPQPTSETAGHLSTMLGDEGAALEGLATDQMVTVDDLKITEGLPEEWINVLLLGSDERKEAESARTDSMIICSVNTVTGEVKLTSIMRDLAVDFDDIGAYNGVYRINAANYFGGERLAMKTVNECFGLNIQYYVRINFYGFQYVAHALGGIDIDITKEEMEQINVNIVDQYNWAKHAGIDDRDIPREYLETYGPNTHLDGRQTLGYARIRKLDGGDYERANRQRKVLIALLQKLKGADITQLMEIAMGTMQYFRTNLSVQAIIQIANTVITNGVDNISTFRLPVTGTFVEETRNEQSMFYDCDWARNTADLRSFIYG